MSTSTITKAAAQEHIKSTGELAGEFRKYLPDTSIERFTRAQKQTPEEYGRFFDENRAPPWLHELVTEWRELIKEPYKGVTVDGNVIPDLFPIQDEGLDIESITSAAQNILSVTSDAEKRAVQFPLDARERRKWSNPEMLINPFGIRLEHTTPDVRDAIMSLLRATMSPEGYAKATSAMRINGFLGSCCNISNIMNEHSYNFLLFGTPSTTEPWAWSLYGHHLCISAFIYAKQLIISPCFAGAEPNLIDSGPHAGTRILHTEEALGLALMQSLTPTQQKQTQIYAGLKPPAMPDWRWGPDDQRHLLGAFRDNRVVPNEGILVSTLSATQQSYISGILEQYLLYLPAQSREMKLAQCRSYFPETWFSWIGGFGDEDAFYYRVQSPVLVVEFDHHSGVFLTNTEPAKFHIHTIVRTPNAGDYGFALCPKESVRGL